MQFRDGYLCLTTPYVTFWCLCEDREGKVSSKLGAGAAVADGGRWGQMGADGADGGRVGTNDLQGELISL